MPQASPALLPQDFPDGATASAMLLWAEDKCTVAMSFLSSLPGKQFSMCMPSTASTSVSMFQHRMCPEPLQALMLTAVGKLTGIASFQPFSSDSAHSSSSAPSQPASSKPQSAPRTSGRASNPVFLTGWCPLQPLGRPNDPPPYSFFPSMSMASGENRS